VHDPNSFTAGSLFTGIGGFDLGLIESGWKILFQVENERFKQRILKKRFPNVELHSDIRFLDYGLLPRPRLLCGGFPCQDISKANSVERKGLRGEKSGLWKEFLKAIINLKPEWVLVENSDQLFNWVPEVRASLSRHSYASLSLVLSSGFIGAKHSRPRGFVVANSNGESQPLLSLYDEMADLSKMARKVPWPAPPDRMGMAPWIPNRMDRLKSLGDSVDPKIIYLFGLALKRIILRESKI
jgi:DNA (cytosine-5)-methyltransferase 1